MESSLNNIIQDNDLKWIFVGGKGGVGKTTTSCTLAIKLAKARPNEKLLLISTDPAHNTSDTFNQKLTSTPTKINGVDNLSCMEIDPTTSASAIPDIPGQGNSENTAIKSQMTKILNSLPGMDEALAYVEVLKLVKQNSYDRVIFDTAPTGHTLRFLDFPNIIDKSLGKILEMRDMIGPMVSTIGGMMGGGIDIDSMNKKMDDIVPLVKNIRDEFKNPTKTTFVCVCIAEFLSLYETERLIQRLMELEIDSRNIVVNQLILSEKGSSARDTFHHRRKLQEKYLNQYNDLYQEDFYLVKIPLLEKEVRGLDQLESFSNLLVASPNPKESIQAPIIDTHSYKWIFVGGKGGVGKTTTSCSLALKLSKTRKNVLLISTDPAHNTSDAFSQKFSKEPTQVNGVENLFVMEINVEMGSKGLPDGIADTLSDDQNFLNIGKKMMQEFFGSCPGIDEAMAYYEIWKLVEKMNFDCVIFDTAPTGHTLRLLNFPTLLEQTLGKLVQIKSQIGPMVDAMGSMLGLGGQDGLDFNVFSEKLESYLPVVKRIRDEFKDPSQTTFVCVCISEFLSLYETERLIQELMNLEIDCQTICINQLLLHDDQTEVLYNHRVKQQTKYLQQIEDLYGDMFHIVKLPLLSQEIRGIEALTNFTKYLDG